MTKQTDLSRRGEGIILPSLKTYSTQKLKYNMENKRQKLILTGVE